LVVELLCCWAFDVKVRQHQKPECFDVHDREIITKEGRAVSHCVLMIWCLWQRVKRVQLHSV